MSNVFVSLGTFGGLTYIALVLLVLRAALRVATERRDAVSLAALGTLVVLFGEWLNGGFYAASPSYGSPLGSWSPASRAGTDVAASPGRRGSIRSGGQRRCCPSLRHRGPDDTGLYADNDAGVAIGATRLSIIDIAGGHQPIANEDETVHCALNGEIYNFRLPPRPTGQQGPCIPHPDGHRDPRSPVRGIRQRPRTCARRDVRVCALGQLHPNTAARSRPSWREATVHARGERLSHFRLRADGIATTAPNWHTHSTPSRSTSTSRSATFPARGRSSSASSNCCKGRSRSGAREKRCGTPATGRPASTRGGRETMKRA